MASPRHHNAALEFVDRHVEEGRSQRVAFIDPTRQLTYGELADRAKRLGTALGALGVECEARVVMLVEDTVDFPVIFWGAIRAGVVPIPLNTLLPVDQIRYILEDSRARLVFASKSLMASVTQAASGLSFIKGIVQVGSDLGGSELDLEQLLSQAEPAASSADTCGDDVAFWLYSSGSTGMPKGVKHVQTSLMETARLFGQGVIRITENDIVHSAAKLFFAYGLGNGMSFPMSVGATTVLWSGRPSPKTAFDLLKTHRVSLFFGVPTLYAAMLAEPYCTRDNCSSALRLCVSAGEALPEHIGMAWKRRFGVDIIDGIGSTEMLHIFLSNRPDMIRYGTSGVPVPGYKVRLVDETGHEVPDGEVGELLVSGPSCADGYWNQREKTRRAFEGEWQRTGDKYVRESSFYRYCGRNDDMFKVSGIWVSPFEIESALASHEAVIEAAVVAAQDDDGLLKPKAFVVLKDSARRADESLSVELKNHVKQSIGAWKYPRWIEIVESLPKTATGKIQRFKLRGETATVME